MTAGYFHYSVATRSRSNGFNAVLHAAYISGQTLYDEREMEQKRWGSKERVAWHDVSIPEVAPEWVQKAAKRRDQEVIWNRAEAAETRKNSVLYRSVTLGIDDSLFVKDDRGKVDLERSRSLQAKVLREHIEKNFTSRGMVASWAIHWNPRNPLENPHAHIMLTTRLATERGFGEKEGGPGRPWKENRCEQWRKDWAEEQNVELQRLAAHYRVDHRSYERQGAEEIAAEQKHYGKGYRKEANERHHGLQAERLIRNPRPVFDLMGKHFVAPFREEDLAVYAERFAKTHDARQRLLASMKSSRELVPQEQGLYVTQGMIAKRCREHLADVLATLDGCTSRCDLDVKLAGAGYRLEKVQRDGRAVYDLIRKDKPGERVSAYRVDDRFGPKAMAYRFPEERDASKEKDAVEPPRTIKPAAELNETLDTILSSGSLGRQQGPPAKDPEAPKKPPAASIGSLSSSPERDAAASEERNAPVLDGPEEKQRLQQELARLAARQDEIRKTYGDGDKEQRAKAAAEWERLRKEAAAKQRELDMLMRREAGKDDRVDKEWRTQAKDGMMQPKNAAPQQRPPTPRQYTPPTQPAPVYSIGQRDAESERLSRQRIEAYSKMDLTYLAMTRDNAEAKNRVVFFRTGNTDPLALEIRSEVEQAMVAHPGFTAWRKSHPEAAPGLERRVAFAQKAQQRGRNPAEERERRK